MLALAGLSTLFLAKLPWGNNHSEIERGSSLETISATTSSLPSGAYKGKALFQAQCASCHNVFKNGTGPALGGFEERGPWADRKKLYAWINNPTAFMKKDRYTRELNKQYDFGMISFPALSPEEIDAIADYINATWKISPVVALN